MERVKLTKTDIATLECAVRLEQRHAGIGPRGSSQHRHFRKLNKLKLLKLVGWGVDIDSDSIEGRDLLIYELTVKGRRAIAGRR